MPFWEKDKEFYATLLRITIPIALQNLISASLNMIDTLMIGQLGENQIAAVGLANEVFFLLNLFLFGICSGTGIFVAQFWGKGDIKNIRRVLGLSIFCGLGISGIFTFVALAMPEKALGVFTRDPAVIELGVSYLSIVGLSYVMTAITYTYAFALRNTAQPKIPMILSAIAVVTNAVFNYILIFGKLGLPAMGVRGAALATVIARALELGLVLWVVYGYDLPAAARLRDMVDLSLSFVGGFFRTALPVILNEGLWALGVTTYSVIYGRMGTGVVAAVNISGTVER
ncbi:MAG: MATE family efflux transporter, partial [Firmicutes bacterium]|nr:MATE family efflux transporter [Bacillota bacterium]